MTLRLSTLIILFLSFIALNGFSKIPVLDDFDRDQTIEIWLNESSNLILEEAYQYQEKTFVQFSSVLRESDQSQRFYAVTSMPLNTKEEDIYFVIGNADEFQENRVQEDLRILTEKQKEKVMSRARFVTDAKRRYHPKRLEKGIKTADQLILDGHVFGLVTRPVSSSYRLVKWMGGTGKDFLLQDISRYFENQEIPPLYEGEGMDLDAFEERLNEMFGKEQANGTMTFYIGGDEYFPRQLQAFKEAKHNINVRIFIFDNDDYGVKIADVLKEQSKDIDVRVLLDGMGVLMGEGATSATLPKGFVSPKSMVNYLKADSNLSVRVRPNAWFKADHTKTIFIDEETVFTGGMNFGREYRYDWHDMMMELRGPIVQKLLREYEVAWSHAGKMGDLAYLRTLVKGREKEVDFEGGFPIRPLYTRAGDQEIFKAQIEAIKAAKKYIYISNAYFSDNAIIYELIRARRRGVDVRIILPIHGNHEIMNKSNLVTANVLFENGIKVYFYPGMSHIKAAIYDGWFCAGSANFDKLSFRDNVELNIATSHPEAVEEIKERLFEVDLKKSAPMEAPVKTNIRDHFAEFLAEQL